MNWKINGTDRCGVSVKVDGQARFASWSDLLAAAGQDDPGQYPAILAAARQVAARGPVEVAVGRDETGVWWQCSVRAFHGHGDADYSRRADEGGTHPNWLCAALEADGICRRLGARVVSRIGFDSVRARHLHAKVMSA